MSFNSLPLSHRNARLAGVALASLAVVAVAGCSGRSPRYNRNAYSNGYVSGTQYTGTPGYGRYPAGGGNTAGAAMPPTAAGAMGMVQSADRTLRGQGFQPLGQVVQQRMPNRGLVAFPITAQPGLCYSVFAVGDTGVQDVDLEIISPSGASVGHDQNPDIHPNVSFCAYEPGLHLARVNVFSGSGNVYVGIYQGPAGTTANLASAFDGGGAGGPAAAPVPSQPDPGTGARVTALAQQMSSTGYQPIGQLSGVSMRSGETQRWSAQLFAGQCYTFAVFAGPGVSDADLFVLQQGRTLARDTAMVADAAVRDVCITQTGSYFVSPHIAGGAGVVWFAAYARPNRAAAPTGTPTQVTQTPIAINMHTGSTGGLDSTYNGVSRDLQRVGYAPFSEPLNLQLNEGQDQSQPVRFEAGACYAVAAAGDSTVRDLDLFLTDPSGAEVDRDYAQDADPVVRVCPPATGEFTLRMHMTAGQGGIRLGLFRWNSGTSGAGMSGLLFVRNAEVTRILQADGYQGDADFELVRGTIREGRSATRTVNLQNGACYAFVGVGGTGVSDLNLVVQHGRAAVAEDRTLGAFPAARYCAHESGAHSVVISSAHGSGDFVFRVFRRQDAAPGGAI